MNTRVDINRNTRVGIIGTRVFMFHRGPGSPGHGTHTKAHHSNYLSVAIRWTAVATDSGCALAPGLLGCVA